MTGKSRFRAASNPSSPRPSSEKIISVNMAPVNRMPMKAAGNPAMTISMALRNMWP